MKRIVGILTFFIIAFLVGAAIFCVLKYIFYLKEENLDLENDKQTLTEILKKERELEEKLIQEKAAVKADLQVSQERLAKLATDFQQVQNFVEQLNSENTALKTENDNLKDEQYSLNNKLIQMTQENDSFKARLGSLVELKKAIRELKQKMRSKTHGEIKEKTQPERIREGNRGYLIKSGKTTYPSKAKIEVNLVTATDR